VWRAHGVADGDHARGFADGVAEGCLDVYIGCVSLEPESVFRDRDGSIIMEKGR
jgi:hypothetical protein